MRSKTSRTIYGKHDLTLWQLDCACNGCPRGSGSGVKGPCWLVLRKPWSWFCISSDWSYFSQECDRLKIVFLKLKYPKHLFNLAVKKFVHSKVADQQHIPSTDTTTPPIRVIIPFKDQVSAYVVKRRLRDLSSNIRTSIQPVFVSRKLNEDLKVWEVKPAIVNQQCIVYKFQCNLCDAGYVGYTCGHLHERVNGHTKIVVSL